jgi:addiction module HigA family antidote
VIDAHRLSVTDAARVLGVTRPAFSALLNGRAQLSAQMALRIEKAFGLRMDELMLMQARYEIAQARENRQQINVAPYKQWGNS